MTLSRQLSVFSRQTIVPLISALFNAASLFVGLYGQSVALKAISGSLGCTGILFTLLTIRQPPAEVSQPSILEMGHIKSRKRMPSTSSWTPPPSLFKDDVRQSPPSPPRTPPPQLDANSAAVFPPDSPSNNLGEGRQELKELADKFQPCVVEYRETPPSVESRVWRSFVSVNGQEMGSGTGRSKGAARDSAAIQAVQRLRNENFSFGIS